MSNDREKTFLKDGLWARYVEGKQIPSAISTSIKLCGHPECEHVHLIGRNLTNEPCFEIVLSEDHILEAYRLVDSVRKK